MDAATETTTVERRLSIAASPETVWEFLVDPEKATRWMGQRAASDVRPGGLYRCEVIPGHTARGEFVELDPPRRLVFTWGWETTSDENASAVPPGSSTIEIELIPDGPSTIVHFVHRDLPNADSAASHGHGWDHYLARLETAAAGGDPGEDPWLTQDMQAGG
jgi:uncharacterized protein YndB with AHSA1/START domain